MTLSSHQDYSASQAGNTAAIRRLHAAFPEMPGVNRSANSDLDIKFQAELHDAMGYRRDNCDDF